MKTLNNYINEALIKKNTKLEEYKYHPKDKDELRSLLEQLLEERGENAYLNDIDVSNIEDMSYLFSELNPYNIDISEWNVSNVKKMNSMFNGCKNFNCDLSNWDVSNVEHIEFMFWRCYKFNSDLSNWNVSNVNDITNIFYNSTLEGKEKKWWGRIK
jgi:surface protein